jgi:hypothetical protein
MVAHKGNDTIQLARPKAAVARQRNGIEPNLRRCAAFVDMNMRRLTGFVAVEVKAKTGGANNRGNKLLPFAIRQQQ